jgi:hypothetical protein
MIKKEEIQSEAYNLQRKVNQYKEVLQNTLNYRQAWKDGLREELSATLEALIKATGLEAKVEVRSDIENLQAVVLTLGQAKSGMYQKVNDDVRRDLIKYNGSLVYQQLFNGKIIVLIHYPFIENYGEPRPPKTIAIYRPEELRHPYFIRHLEEFILEITNWEDFDDDEPNKRIGFQLNFNADGANDGKDKR